MNPLMMLLLLAPNLLSGLGGSSGLTGSNMLLPMMLMGGGKMNTMSMLGLMTNQPILTIMGMTQKKSYRRRGRSAATRAAYWKGRATARYSRY